MNEQGTPSYLIYIGIFVTVFIAALGVFIWTSQSKTKDLAMENKLQEAPKTEASTTAQPASASTNEALKLTVASPEDNAIINTTTVKIAGAAKAGTTVTITGGNEDIVSEANNDGSFALDVPLKDGENNLTITVFDQTGQQKSVTKTVYAVVEG